MDVNFTPQGPPDVVLPDPDPALVAALGEAADDPAAVAAVVASSPTFLAAWAQLGELTAADTERTDIEAYAYFRVGYHRGLDALRKNGWKGSGFVRWSAETNRCFLRCLQGLGQQAARIGEEDEAVRCREFLIQLDPGGPWSD